MSSASSTRTFLTFWPCDPVWCVMSCMPMILLASSTASSGVFASLTPPPFPRPPAWICAFTTARPPNSFAMRPASSGESVTRPRGVATPNPRRISLAWYSCIFMATGEVSRGKRRRSMMKLIHMVRLVSLHAPLSRRHRVDERHLPKAFPGRQRGRLEPRDDRADEELRVTRRDGIDVGDERDL